MNRSVPQGGSGSVRRLLISTSLFVALSCPAFGAGTLVQIQANGDVVKTSNPLPVTGSISSTGAVTIASGGVASGAYASGSIASGAFAAGSISDGAEVTIGAKADAKSTATDTTPVTIMQVLKQISASVQSLVTQLSNPLPTSLSSATSGGCTPYTFTSAASTNSTLISTGAHTLCSFSAINTTGTIYFLRFYDAAAAPTCSSATGFIHSYPIPASASGAGVAPPLGPFGEAITTGLGFCLTGGGSSTDNTNAATGVYLNASYK